MAGERRRTIYPNRRARLDATVALAMLPVGVGLGLAAAIASVVLLVGAVAALFSAPGWLPLWRLAAAIACAWIARTAIEIVSAFDWRRLPGVALVLAITVAACPWWW